MRKLRLRKSRAPHPAVFLIGAAAIIAIPVTVFLLRKRAAGLEGHPTIANVPQSGVDPSEGLRAD
jgi:hypothetical protein